MLPLTVYNPTFHVHLYLFQNQQLRFFIPVFPPLITFPHENFIPLPVFSNLKLKCAYSFKAATSRAIWQCLHTISGHNFGFLSHPKNTVLIFVTTAPSNVKIISLKKKKALICQCWWQQLNASNSEYSYEYILLLSSTSESRSSWLCEWIFPK